MTILAKISQMQYCQVDYSKYLCRLWLSWVILCILEKDHRIIEMIRYGTLQAVLPEFWPPMILGSFLEGYVGCEKFAVQFLRNSSCLMFPMSSALRCRGSNREHCILKIFEKDNLYSEVFKSTDFLNKSFILKLTLSR